MRTSVRPVSPTGRGRSLENRLLLRAPGLVRRLAALLQRLPPSSSVRRRLNAHLTHEGVEAANRRDFDALFILFDPQIEFEFEGEPGSPFTFPDLVGVQRGLEAYRGIWRAGDEAYEDMRLRPAEVIDFGEAIVVSGRVTARGRHTGIPLDEPIHQVFWRRRGLIYRQVDFSSREAALRVAAGGERRREPR